MNSFFSYMSRMKHIERWSLMRNTVKENIMEHSEQVAQIAHALAVITNKFYGGKLDAGHITVIAMYHEASEVITGDLPTPIKYYNPEIKTAYKELEKVAEKKLLEMLPEELRSDYQPFIMPDTESPEYKVVKAADKLSAYIKCLEELKSGNREFIKAKEIIQEELGRNPLPAVKYFMENFIAAFEKTLDELE